MRRAVLGYTGPRTGSSYCACFRRFGSTPIAQLSDIGDFVGSPTESDNGTGGDAAPQEQLNSRRPFIGASEIASLISLNPYVKASDAIERLWEKNNRKSFTAAIARNRLRVFSSEEKLESLGLLEAAVSVIETEGQENYQKGLGKVLKQARTAQDRTVVRDYIHTARGIRNEKKIFKALQMQRPPEQLQPDSTLYQQIIKVPESRVQYLISGYIDGIEHHNNRLIEIKTRQNRLFGRVPLYEQVQCQAYLFLTGLNVCEHTESFEGKTNSTTLHFEPNFWNEIVKQLNTVVVAFTKLLRNQGHQDHFLRTGSLDEMTKQKRSSRYLIAQPSRRSIKEERLWEGKRRERDDKV